MEAAVFCRGHPPGYRLSEPRGQEMREGGWSFMVGANVLFQHPMIDTHPPAYFVHTRPSTKRLFIAHANSPQTPLTHFFKIFFLALSGYLGTVSLVPKTQSWFSSQLLALQQPMYRLTKELSYIRYIRILQ